MTDSMPTSDPNAASNLYPNDPFKPTATPSAADNPAPRAARRDDAAATLYSHDPLDAARTLGVNPEQMMPGTADQLTIAIPDERLAAASAAQIAELDAAKAAFFGADLNQSVLDSVASDFWRHAEAPVTTSRDEAIAELRRLHGDTAEEKLALANELVRRTAKTWPGIYDALEAYGSGNDPALIGKVIARAQSLRRAGKL